MRLQNTNLENEIPFLLLTYYLCQVFGISLLFAWYVSADLSNGCG